MIRKFERKPLSFGARAKRRSEAQRVGREGQNIFQAWALEQHLVANPCPEDFGLDYFCQVLQPIRGGEAEELRGDTLLVQVRSVKGGGQSRVVLDKQDAVTALRVEQPYLLVAVNVERKSVRFRFLDSAFADRLAAFVTASQKALTLAVHSDEFSAENFRQLLDKHCNPGVQQRLRLHCMELCLRRDVMGARLKVLQDSSSGVALVEVPSVASIFRVKRDQESVLATHIFERGALPPLGDGISIQPSLFKALQLTGADGLLVRGGMETRMLGYIEKDGKRERVHFRLRRAGNTRAYISESGLILTVSDKVKRRTHGVVHEMGVRLGSEFGRTLDQFDEFDAAFRLIGPGAKVAFEEDGHAFDVAIWGSPLLELGTAYAQIVEALTFAGVPLQLAQLADLTDEEFATSVAVLAALARGATAKEVLPRFLLGPAADDKDYEAKMRPCGFEVPIVMNLKSRGVVIWLSGEGKTYIDDHGRSCGLFVERQQGLRVELRDRRIPKSSMTPEMWVTKDWPAIALLEKPEAVVQFQGGIEHPLGGRIWSIAVNTGSN